MLVDNVLKCFLFSANTGTMAQPGPSQQPAARRVSGQTHPVGVLPVLGHLETLINTLRDPAQRDDAKHNALKVASPEGRKNYMNLLRKSVTASRSL